MEGRGERVRLLQTWGRYVAQAARSGGLTGRPVAVSRVEMVAGPRAGALEIFAGLESGRLLRVLGENDAATLRQFVPWRFVGDPQVFMAGRYVRCEAGWPEGLAERMVRLGDLGGRPRGDGRWVAGRSETGATIVPGLCDRTPHFLVSGATGSGKSVALRSAVLQLSAAEDNEIVLVDGKFGESLRAVERLPGVVAPCAVEGEQVRGALGWAVGEMRRRYEAEEWEGRVVVVVDEFQELVRDEVVVGLLRKLVAQGRAAGVHCLLATQHPTVGSFGDASIRRNLVGKLAMHVLDADASRVAVGGSSPRADRLLGAGDSYAVAPGSCHRVQLAYVDEEEIGAVGWGQWRVARWPEYEAERVGQELPEVGWHYTGDELAVALVAAAAGDGRPAMLNRLEEAELGRPGAERGMRLLRLGRDVNGWLVQNDYAVCLSGEGEGGEGMGRVMADVW